MQSNQIILACSKDLINKHVKGLNQTRCPFPAAAAPASTSGGAADSSADPESVGMLVSIAAVTVRQAQAALKACGGNVERACDWLFSRMDELDAEVEKVLSAATGEAAAGSGLQFQVVKIYISMCCHHGRRLPGRMSGAARDDDDVPRKRQGASATAAWCAAAHMPHGTAVFTTTPAL